LRLRPGVAAARGLELPLGGADLLLLADALERLQVLLGGRETGARLRVCDLRFVDGLARERPFLEQLLPRIDQFLRGIERLARRVDVGLCFHHLFRHGRRCRRAVVRFRLLNLALPFLRLRLQVAVLELREQLPLLHVVAAVHQKAADRRADLRRDVRLVARIQHGVRIDDQADAAALVLYQCQR